MKFNLTLAQKAFVLVCVPLVFEIAFVGILAHLLQQAESERAKEAHAKDVQSQVNGILNLIVDAGAGLIIGEYARSMKIREKYAVKADQAKFEYAALRALVKGHKDEEQAVKRIGDLNEDIHRVLKHAKQDSEDDNKLGLVRDFATLQSLMTEFNKATGDLSAQQRQIERQRSRARVQARTAITRVLFFGLFFNISLAIGLALYFNRGTASRMMILMDNTKRLAKGQQLNPPIAGSDEIAHLDQTFNEMADALALAARKERALIDNASDVICSLDSSLKFSNVNPASEKIWGYDHDELVGKGLDVLLPVDELDRQLEAFSKVSVSEAAMPIENQVQRKDGSQIDMLWSVQWSKKEESYFCIVHDITEQKQIERMKREFVAMVSHDLRTPLTSIQGFLSLVEIGAFGDLNQSGMQSLKIADTSITRLINLINDLLDAERIESGKLEITIGNVSLADVFEQSSQAVSNFASDHGVKIEILQQELVDGIQLRADGDRLIQVLINLLSNAIKFSPEDSTVRLSCQPVDAFYEIKVADEGRGIPAEFVNSVFERFKQVKKSDAREKKGTGLGLAICKAIVEKHGGQIGVTSEEGKGSTFWFRIPKELS